MATDLVTRKILTDRLNGTNPDHQKDENNFVQEIFPERQATKETTITQDGYRFREEWIGTSPYIDCLTEQLLPETVTDWNTNEQFTISRGKGDLSKLTRTYDIPFKKDRGHTAGGTVGENAGVTPWQVQSIKESIGPIEYFILKNNICEEMQKDIMRLVLASWDATDLEHKMKYVAKTSTGYKAIGKDPVDGFCPIGNDLTLSVATFWAESGRDQFPMSHAKIIHTKLGNGKYKTAELSGNIVGVENQDAYKDIYESDLVFPTTFGVQLSSIPELPCKYNNFGLADRNYFFLDDWNIQNYNGTGKYLVQKTYLSWPKLLDDPYPSSTGGKVPDKENQDKDGNETKPEEKPAPEEKPDPQGN